MKPNTVRVLVAICFLVAVVAAYYSGKSARDREIEMIAGESAVGQPGSPSVRDGREKLVGGGAATETKMDGVSSEQLGVKSIINEAFLEMQVGSLEMNSMLRALQVLDGIGDDQILEALTEVELSENRPQLKVTIARMLLARWAEKDGRAALDYAEENFDMEDPKHLIIRSSVIKSWANADPAATWEWYQEQVPGEGVGIYGGDTPVMALTSIFSSFATKNPDLAFDLAEKLEDEQERSLALQGLGQGAWNDRLREKVLARIEAIESESEKESARHAIFSQWIQVDPEESLAWADRLAGDGRKKAIQQIAPSLKWTDPERSADLLLSVAETPEERQQAYSNTISAWAKKDANAAGEWLGRQAQGPELDRALQKFATAVAEKDPESAMAWADTVSDESKRAEAVKEVYKYWVGRDKEAADAALAETQLSAEKIQELQSSER